MKLKEKADAPKSDVLNHLLGCWKSDDEDRKCYFREDGKYYCELDGDMAFKGNYEINGNTIVLNNSRIMFDFEDEHASYEARIGENKLSVVDEDGEPIATMVKAQNGDALGMLKKVSQVLDNERTFCFDEFEGGLYFDMEDFFDQLEDFDGTQDDLVGKLVGRDSYTQYLLPKVALKGMTDEQKSSLVDMMNNMEYCLKSDSTCYVLGSGLASKGTYKTEGSVLCLNMKQFAKDDGITAKEKLNYRDVDEPKETKMILKKYKNYVVISAPNPVVLSWLLMEPSPAGERKKAGLNSFSAYTEDHVFHSKAELVGCWYSTEASMLSMSDEYMDDGRIDAMETAACNRAFYFNHDGTVVYYGGTQFFHGTYEVNGSHFTLNVTRSGSRNVEVIAFDFIAKEGDDHLVFVEENEGYSIGCIVEKK